MKPIPFWIARIVMHEPDNGMQSRRILRDPAIFNGFWPTFAWAGGRMLRRSRNPGAPGRGDGTVRLRSPQAVRHLRQAHRRQGEEVSACGCEGGRWRVMLHSAYSKLPA